MNRNPTTESLASEKPDLEGLRNFANETGRLDPLSFVGRTEILDNFAQNTKGLE